MPKPRKKSRRRASPKTRDDRRETSGETQASEAMTIAWTVSVTMVLICDLIAAMMHLVVRFNHELRGAVLFKELVLYSAAVIGIVSLVLAAVAYRVRRTPPPTGVIVFGVCVAAAPILALIVRSLR
jgi:hypothetical protein